MQVFKTKTFARWAQKEKLQDHSLLRALNEMRAGLVDANLGGHLYKKRVQINKRGKSSSARTILAYNDGKRAFFVFGFTKSKRANISIKELTALKKVAQELLQYNNDQLHQALEKKELLEISYGNF